MSFRKVSFLLLPGQNAIRFNWLLCSFSYLAAIHNVQAPATPGLQFIRRSYYVEYHQRLSVSIPSAPSGFYCPCSYGFTCYICFVTAFIARDPRFIFVVSLSKEMFLEWKDFVKNEILVCVIATAQNRHVIACNGNSLFKNRQKSSAEQN